MKEGSAISGLASWQTTMADLALILFLMTAAALGAAPDPAEAGSKQAGEMASGLFHSEMANASAMYRPGAGAQPLAQWLADQQVDPRQRLTILVHYTPGSEAEAAVEALELLDEAGALAPMARVVMEAADAPRTLVLLAYDLHQTPAETQAPDKVARPLH